VRRHVAAVERDLEQRSRLLERLREMLAGLEYSTAPTVDELIGTVEAMTVVEATIEDIVTRDPWEEAWELRARSSSCCASPAASASCRSGSASRRPRRWQCNVAVCRRRARWATT